jgi:EcsC protein family
MVPLNEYEARQADEIAVWKSERPSLVMAAFRGLSRPLSRLAARVVPDGTIRALVSKAETMSAKFGGWDEIARLAGVHDIRELRKWTLEECDRLAVTIDTPAQRQAMIEGAIAGLGGVVTEILNIPILLSAALRSVYRIGYCYAYRLDSEIDRLFVLAILELSTADEPARREALFQQLKNLSRPAANGLAPAKPVSLDGVEGDLLQDLTFGAVPILGDLTSILMDYDFIRRVDITARRVFQERWLKDHGKLDEIHAAPVSQRRSSLEGGIDLVAQLVYLGSFSVAFGVVFPLTLAARGAAGFDNSLIRGAKQGAGDAALDADRFLSRIRPAMAAAGPATAKAPAELSASAAP